MKKRSVILLAVLLALSLTLASTASARTAETPLDSR